MRNIEILLECGLNLDLDGDGMLGFSDVIVMWIEKVLLSCFLTFSKNIY